MYSRPNMSDTTDRLAHMLSEMHNESAPIGWERYRFLANLLLAKLPIRATVMDERFEDHNFQPGEDMTDVAPGARPDLSAAHVLATALSAIEKEWSVMPVLDLACNLLRHKINDLQSSTADLPYTVKPLVWHPIHGCSAVGLGIEYHMSETTPGLFSLYAPFHTEEDLPKAEIQALAQADYAARVRAELVTL